MLPRYRRRGSIPAGAGEPVVPAFQPAGPGVYPRGCGGTIYTLRLRPGDDGLSPRVRGNRFAPRWIRRSRGSIPAGAGEPSRSCCPGHLSTVYPRGCGGTDVDQVLEFLATGLSPRVRGNRRVEVGLRDEDGSIPAGAGEPKEGEGLCDCQRVYPPRVRGNHGYMVFRPHMIRSIPAGAGEPVPQPLVSGLQGVYPRGCGGTRPTSPVGSSPNGLSPRVRGNHRRDGAGGLGPGSIPAGCGGTLLPEGRRALQAGLSPRVRGNRHRRAGTAYAERSIPAGAGEPSTARCSPAPRQVYPRGCGGTESCGGRTWRVLGLSPRVRGNPRRPWW